MSNHRKNRVLHFLFVAVYMVSYITRINFGAVISEIERDTQWSRTVLSAVVTGSFIAYGAGQIISGIIGDRFSPKKLVLLGLMVTVTMNLLMPLCSTPYGMMAVWCINGIAALGAVVCLLVVKPWQRRFMEKDRHVSNFG